MANLSFERLRSRLSRKWQTIARQVILPDLAGDSGRVMREAVAADGALTSGDMLTAARRDIIGASGVRDQDIARIDVSWPLFGKPQISASVHIVPVAAPGCPRPFRRRRRFQEPQG